jgi:hypothetical protein
MVGEGQGGETEFERLVDEDGGPVGTVGGGGMGVEVDGHVVLSPR